MVSMRCKTMEPRISRVAASTFVPSSVNMVILLSGEATLVLPKEISLVLD